MCFNWNILINIVPSVIAVIALFQTGYQTKLSNKQHLFDRRLDAYKRVRGLMELYQENEKILSEKDKNEPLIENAWLFMRLTNNAEMESCAKAITHRKVEPYHQNFLKMIEELKRAAIEFEMLFEGDMAISIRRFIEAYAEVLLSMYQYQDIIEMMKKKNSESPTAIDELQNMLSEPNHRRKLNESLEKLKETYDKASDSKVISKIYKQIKLR